MLRQPRQSTYSRDGIGAPSSTSIRISRRGDSRPSHATHYVAQKQKAAQLSLSGLSNWVVGRE
ncbi:protein of unknown function [Pararobbsia alpina]